MDKRSGAGLNHTDTGVDIELRCFRVDEPTDVDDTRDDDLNQIESDNESASAFDNIRLELSEYDVGHSVGEQRNSVNLGVADGRPGQFGRGINRHSDSLTNNKRSTCLRCFNGSLVSAEVNCHECGAHSGRNSTLVFDGPHGGGGTASVQDSCNNGDLLSDYVSRRTDGKRSTCRECFNSSLRSTEMDCHECGADLGKRLNNGKKKLAEKQSEQHPREFNVLLLGETGVGKSTLINAFANYVNYKTFDEAARQTKPLCLISTHFQEFTKTINIEGKNNLNEGTDPTKSGTHAPSTYSFKCEDLIVRFIDTPGLHDTRGSARDKYNFEKLSSYLSEYDEIHGICILLKPDQQKLTENFTALIKRLIDYFSRDAIENIVFCFTFAKNEMKRKCCPTENAIRTFLADNNMDYMILNPKEKFYYVDNESFKYLCAKCCNVDYDEEEIVNFKKCWDQSETELCRMLHHFWSLEPHSYSHTASLHHYQHLLRKLTEPIGLVAVTIQENIDIMEEQLGKLGDHRADLNGLKELKERITIENICITPVKYPHPRVVCKSAQCQPSCMPREYCIEAKDREIKEKIKYWFFFLHTACNVCGCEYNEHSIDSYRLRRDVVDVEYYPLGETLKNQYEERNVLLASLAKLSRISTAIFQQRWFPADDESYFEKQIEEETKKLEGVRNQKRLALLGNVRNLYTAARSTTNNEPTLDEVSEIEPLIRSLPINGAMLGEIIDAQEDTMNEKADVFETEFNVGEQTCHPWFLCLLRKKMSEQEAFMFLLQNSN